MSKRNNEEKIRLAITNWDGVVPIAISKGHDKMSRKVLTRGVLTSHDLGTLHRAYVESVLGTITGILRSGSLRGGLASKISLLGSLRGGLASKISVWGSLRGGLASKISVSGPTAFAL